MYYIVIHIYIYIYIYTSVVAAPIRRGRWAARQTTVPVLLCFRGEASAPSWMSALDENWNRRCEHVEELVSSAAEVHRSRPST